MILFSLPECGMVIFMAGCRNWCFFSRGKRDVRRKFQCCAHLQRFYIVYYGLTALLIRSASFQQALCLKDTKDFIEKIKLHTRLYKRHSCLNILLSNQTNAT